MQKRIVRRFENAQYCFVCGVNNDAGLHANYYLADDGTVIGLATAREVHQSYPFCVHGGVSASLLDDAMGRSIKAIEPDRWSVTVEMTTVYKRPVPYGEPLIVTGLLTEDGEKVYSTYGEIILPDGTVAVTATGKFFKMSLERLAARGADESYNVPVDDNFPETIEIPEKN
ncbi:MAG: PaaI family thioesterase [Oscillospiraceae bacterium]|jgi:acyl-coenzyme A thioesterase PaaI-like protein